MPPPLPESPHALRSFVAVRPPPPGRHSPCENLAHFFVFAPLHRHSLLHNLATCRFFSLPVSPPPVAQFQHMSFFAPLSLRHLQHNFSTCRFFAPLGRHSLLCNLRRHIHRAISTHLSSSTPGALPTCLFFVRTPGSPHPLRKLNTFIVSLPLGRHISFFSRPWLPQPSEQFEVWIWPPFFLIRPSGEWEIRGESSVCSIGCRQSRCAISTFFVLFGFSWSPQPLRNFGAFFFRRPSTSIVTTVE